MNGLPGTLSIAACLLLTAYPGQLAAQTASLPNQDLIAHWPLAGDTQDRSSNGYHAVQRGGVDLQAEGPSGAKQSAAGFNGRDGWLEVAAGSAPQFGTGDFSIATWLYTDGELDDVIGDLISQYDAEQRRGWHLSVKSNSAVTSLGNHRQLQFSIDDKQASTWSNCGRPGNSLLGFALASYQGQLYVGTCEPGADEAGHVYRYAGSERWIDCGSPDPSNSVTCLAEFDGQLYAATGKYRLRGSALPESENTELGGRIFRYAGEQRWIACGRLPDTEAVGGLTVFRGKLYASSLYHPPGFYRYDGGSQWTDCGTPEKKRVVAMAPYNGHLYAACYDGGYVFRYDGDRWIDCGKLGENTQTYSFAIYQGDLHVGTWPSGRVYRFEDVGRWADVGRLGEELEVMGMVVHNGRLLAGTLPMAEVYSYEGGDTWKRIAQLDQTPDVKYRRLWAMAEHDGKAFCTTLPSGKVFSFQAGRTAASDQPLPAGWHHIAAVKADDRLTLYVDHEQVAQSEAFDASKFNVTSGAPLRIGFGANDVLRGRLADLRLYGRALSSSEIKQLGKP